MAGISNRLLDLDNALAALGEEAMMLSQLDGFIAGLVVCPDLIAPSEWLSEVWGAEDKAGEPAFDSAAQLETIVGLIMAHYNDVADTLRRRPSRYGPVFDVYAPTDETFWEFWIGGFEAAMALRPGAWLPVVAAEGEAAEALALLLTLAGMARKDPKLELDQIRIDELSQSAPDLIAECVVTLAAWRLGQSTPAGRGAKVGRNEPCPCGSGRKHKKCCGAN